MNGPKAHIRRRGRGRQQVAEVGGQMLGDDVGHARGEPHQEARIANGPRHCIHRIVVEARLRPDVRERAGGGRPVREHSGRGAIRKERIHHHALQRILHLKVQGAQLGAHHQYARLGVLLTEAVGHPQRVKGRVAAHKSDERARRAPPQAQALDQFDVEPRCKEPRAARHHHVRHVRCFQPGVVERALRDVGGQGHHRGPIVLVALARGGRRLQCPVGRKECEVRRIVAPIIRDAAVAVVDV